MVRCTNCNELIRADSKRCFECGHVFTESEISAFAEQEKAHEEKLRLHRKLTMRADNSEYIGTLCVIIAICLIFPIFANWFNYSKQSGAIDGYYYALDDKKEELAQMSETDSNYEYLQKSIHRNELLIDSTEEYVVTCARKTVVYGSLFILSVGTAVFCYYYHNSSIKKRNGLV